VQRKVFRVEQMFANRRGATQTGERDAVDQLKTLRQLGGRHDLGADELARELAAVQDTIARNRRELAALIGDGKNPRFARAAGELGAAVAGMEKATQKILHEAERVEEYARTLGSTLKTDYERGLAQDIQDHTVQIYEACNFQDLAGQRIAKVIETLNLVEAQLSAMLARCNGRPAEAQVKAAAGGGLINGPKLDGDIGHASQHDIDKIFG
jgi:chemotaxis protein CheZ